MTESPEGAAAYGRPARFGSTGAVEAARDVVADRAAPVERRLEVLRRIGASIVRLPGGIDTLLEIAAEPHDDPAVRRAATDLLGAAASDSTGFRPHRTAYVDLLRSLISDPVPELRHTAVTTLATERDEVVQQVLLDGLQGRGPLPVERNRAIELLAEDDRLDTVAWLRQLYASTQEGNRVTALRLMGRHPAAADEIAQILQDGTETATVRLQGAAALRALAPERFAAAAKEIVLDPDDDPEVRAGCLDRLRLADHGAAVRGDPEFLRRLRTVADEATDSGVASLAQEILDDAPPAPGS